jgi:hypothetical protein
MKKKTNKKYKKAFYKKFTFGGLEVKQILDSLTIIKK